ncbi:MAG: PQQ-binding-like beta-propeller repeat protein, partial [Solirubrobacterales bacterium]|nr:PQQ-binding-like beta-propeller repeat protein [Solirubrobacterales bacterium]
MILCALLALLLAVTLAVSASATPAWTTYHRDAARSGADPDGVEPRPPSLDWRSPDLGAPIWGQPLLLGGRVYVATVGDRLSALDAASGAVVWSTSLGTPVPAGALPCGDVTPTVGVVGTPVIDPGAGVIYAVADTWDATAGEAHHVLVGLALAGGEQVLRTPVDPPGADPKALLQRTALNLDAGHVVFGFGGNDGDCGEYRGAVVSVPEDGSPASFWQTPIALPSKSGGAVWATSGPAVDGEGHIFAATGNPNPPSGQTASKYDYSDSVVELSPSLALQGAFAPPNWEAESNSDLDLASAGPELLPGGMLFQAGKDGIGHLIAEASMGAQAPAVYSHAVCGGHGSFGGDAYAAGVIYIPCTNGVQALAYDQAARSFTPIWQGPGDAFGAPILSAGLVWSAATGGFKGGGTKLYGLDPASGAVRYTETLPQPIADHFGSPSAGGGRLFISTGTSVTAYRVAQLTALSEPALSEPAAPGRSTP